VVRLGKLVRPSRLVRPGTVRGDLVEDLSLAQVCVYMARVTRVRVYMARVGAHVFRGSSMLGSGSISGNLVLSCCTHFGALKPEH
jgi:hypothetical protein